MATTKAKLEIGTVYSVKGENAKLVEAKSGWFTFDNGAKARAKDVKPLKNGTTTAETTGERTFTVHDPETGEIARRAIFKMDRYIRHGDASTEGGYKPLDIGDDVAGMLRGLGIEEQFEEAARIVRSYRDEKWGGTKTEIEAEMRHRYEKLNPGQIRMNLGNVIRGCAKRAERAEEEAA